MRRTVAALTAFLTLPAFAEDIVLLTGPDDLTVEGVLLDHDGRFYRIDAEEGVLTLDGAAFDCEGAACPGAPNRLEEVVIVADPVIAGILLPALIEAHAVRTDRSARRFPEGDGAVWVLSAPGEREVLLHVRPAFADAAVAALAADEADIAVTMRTVTPRERASGEEAGSGDPGAPSRGRVLALTAAAPVVAPGTGVEAVTLPQLAALFAGEIVSWDAIGGAAIPVVPHLPAEGTGLAPSFREGVMAAAGLNVAEDARRHPGEAALLDAVGASPGAIGIAVAGRSGPAQPLALRSDCGPRLRPSREAIRTGDWPLTTPVMAYLPARPLTAEAAAFLRFALSPEAQLVIRRAGLVDQAAADLPLATQGERLAGAILAARDEADLAELQRMVRRLRPLTRQGATFRFAPGGTGLDTPSREAAIRLAAALADGRQRGPVLLVGFSDGARRPEASRRAALRQAGRVAAALRARLPEDAEVEIEVESFGAAMPLACDDTSWGRRANRRVEVWLP